MCRAPFACLIGAIAALIVASSGVGCSSRPAPYRPLTAASQNTEAARELNTEAADLMESDPDRAEQLLREALTADIYFGPAHNNLGVLLMQRGELYAAANEFQWAKRVLPGHPDPRLNLGLVLERAGKIDDAIHAYRAALEVYPGYLPAIMALTKAEVRISDVSTETRERLETIAFRSTDPRWTQWARSKLIKLTGEW